MKGTIMYYPLRSWLRKKHQSMARKAIDFWVQEKGQGTTEYAILVGVLVVIAIIAITLFRPKIQELWDAIASGINGL
jgi:Flp pilus assembly pilin Flp